MRLTLGGLGSRGHSAGRCRRLRLRLGLLLCRRRTDAAATIFLKEDVVEARLDAGDGLRQERAPSRRSLVWRRHSGILASLGYVEVSL